MNMTEYAACKQALLQSVNSTSDNFIITFQLNGMKEIMI